MFDVETFSKTAKGREEMHERSHGLALRLRTALILVDGKTPWATLRPMLARIGDPEALIQALRDEGMIESDFDLPPLPIFRSLTEFPQTLGGK